MNMVSLTRFAAASVTQAPVTLFNFCDFESHVRQFPKQVFVLTALGLAVIVGWFNGLGSIPVSVINPGVRLGPEAVMAKKCGTITF